jgi:hypothetical protein
MDQADVEGAMDGTMGGSGRSRRNDSCLLVLHITITPINEFLKLLLYHHYIDYLSILL